MTKRRPFRLWMAGGVVLAIAAFALLFLVRARHQGPHSVSVKITSTNAQALLREADYLAYLGNWQKAQPYFERAENLFAAKGDKRDELYCKVSCVQFDVEHGSYAAASRYLADQLRNPIVQTHPRLKLRCLTIKGIVDLNTNTATAEDDWTEALQLARQLHDPIWQNRATGWLGIVDFVNGNSGRATRRVLEAIADARWRGDINGEEEFLTYFGDGLIAVNRPSEALECLNMALGVERSNPDAPVPYRTVIAKIDALEELHQYEQARGLLAQTLAEARRTQTLGAQAELLRETGQLDRATRNIPPAEAAYEQSATVSTQASLPRLLAESEFQLTDLYREQGDLAKAQEAVSQGIDAVREVEAPYELPHYLAVEAELKESAHHFHQADALFGQAEDLVEGMLLDAHNSTLETSLLDAMSDIYVHHFRLAALSLKNVGEAFEIVEQERGRALADSLRSHKRRMKRNSSEDNPAQAQIDDIQRQLRQPHTSEERARLLDNLDVAEAMFAHNEYGDARIKRLAPARPISLQAFQGSLEPDEMALEYVLASPNSFCLAITPKTATVKTLPAEARIEATVRRYLEDVKAKQPVTVPAKLLYQWLLADCIGKSRARRLLLIPDGMLNDLPFDALQDSRGHYALESHVITVAPSATVLHILRSEGQPQDTFTFLGVGYAKGPMLASTDPTLPDRVERDVRGIFGMENPTLSPLPYSQEEVESAAKFMGPGSIVLLGSKATKENVVAEPLADFKILHFAVHGVADKHNPDRSALVFREGTSPNDDGLLQVRDIRRLSLDADLVTLSACDTDIGKIEGEEGVDNMTGAFLMAGARNVLASLWAVNDRWTATLMDKFYHHLAKGMEVSKALDQAKLDILKQYGPAVLPRYWAGFVLIGDGDAKITRGDNAETTQQK